MFNPSHSFLPFPYFQSFHSRSFGYRLLVTRFERFQIIAHYGAHVKLYEDLMSHLHVSWVMCMYVMITNDYDDSYENGTQTRKSLLVCQDPLDW